MDICGNSGPCADASKAGTSNRGPRPTTESEEHMRSRLKESWHKFLSRQLIWIAKRRSRQLTVRKSQAYNRSSRKTPTQSAPHAGGDAVSGMSTTDLAQTPAASPPPGVTSDLLHPYTKHTRSGVVAAIIGMFIAAIFLMIRIYTKVFLARRFGFDDVALLLSKVGSQIA